MTASAETIPIKEQTQVFSGKKILIIVENLPAPFDRRVWHEACTLTEAGAQVSIICPQMKGYVKSYERIDGIDIYRHPLPIEARGAMGYLVEYPIALWWEFWLTLKLVLKGKVDVIQACNPPDLIFLVALPFRLLGKKFIFDHHDINPEFYIAKFERKDLFYRMLLLVERLTYGLADFAISTNESYKEIAIRRGKMDPDKVQVVRSGPKVDRMKLGTGNENHKKGKKFMVGYVGVISQAEGLDILMEVAKMLKTERNDTQFGIIGSGPEIEEIKRLAVSMEIDDVVTFYGRASDEVMVEVLNTCDVCVNPDKPSAMNNLSTMNKIMEYMCLKKPIVQFDLKEGRFSAQKASLYAKPNDNRDFADKIITLLDDEAMRREMGEFGYNRVTNELLWDHEKHKLIDVYKKVLKIA